MCYCDDFYMVRDVLPWEQLKSAPQKLQIYLMPSIIRDRFKWHKVLYFDKDNILLQSAKSVLWINEHKLSNATGDGVVCGCTLRGKYINEKAKHSTNLVWNETFF